MSLEAIFAMSQNRVIGKDGKIPWYLPEDFKLFKEITLGHRVIMGRKTLESIKKRKALPNRENFVLTQKSYTEKLPNISAPPIINNYILRLFFLIQFFLYLLDSDKETRNILSLFCLFLSNIEWKKILGMVLYNFKKSFSR